MIDFPAELFPVAALCETSSPLGTSTARAPHHVPQDSEGKSEPLGTSIPDTSCKASFWSKAPQVLKNRSILKEIFCVSDWRGCAEPPPCRGTKTALPTGLGDSLRPAARSPLLNLGTVNTTSPGGAAKEPLLPTPVHPAHGRCSPVLPQPLARATHPSLQTLESPLPLFRNEQHLLNHFPKQIFFFFFFVPPGKPS